MSFSPPSLQLEFEAKVRELLGNPLEKRFEASGVCVRDGVFYIIFDNASQLAAIELDDHYQPKASHMYPLHSIFSGYEDISYDAQAGRFYTLIESLQFAENLYKARIEVYDEALQYLFGGWADFPFRRKNKGLEGLTHVYYQAQLYLLGLCEGNRCRGGRAGRQAGQGRIQVFKEGEEDWAHVRSFKLPESVAFEDYASLDIHGRRVAIVSQASSLLWIGQLHADSWTLIDEGQIYQFPRTRKGKPLYCNIEGVVWLDAQRIAVVSDRAKPRKQAKRCRRKDQSLHIFSIP